MDDLVQWLGEQLDEDERIARAASWCDEAASWRTEPSPFGARHAGQRWYVEDAMDDGVISHVDPAASDDEGVARHIARHDPARVLREIDAKRRLVEDLLSDPHVEVDDPFYSCAVVARADVKRFGGVCDCGRDDRLLQRLRLLALPYADRPGFREEWRP